MCRQQKEENNNKVWEEEHGDHKKIQRKITFSSRLQKLWRKITLEIKVGMQDDCFWGWERSLPWVEDRLSCWMLEEQKSVCPAPWGMQNETCCGLYFPPAGCQKKSSSGQPPGHGHRERIIPQLLTSMHSHSGDHAELASLAQNGKSRQNPVC